MSAPTRRDFAQGSIWCGQVLDVLELLPEGSAQCCVTSPPYYRLRDYGVPGQIGMEATPEEYVAKLVEVFRQVRRVLRDDGTLWLNLGDSYASKPNGPHGIPKEGSIAPHVSVRTAHARRSGCVPKGFKHKDLIGIPWRVALALQADGWFLRQDIIWHKPNPMPESVRDRCTKAHEYLFLLSKSARYHYDAEAVKEKAVRGYAGSTFTSGKTATHQLGRASNLPRRGARDNFKRAASKRAQAIPGQHVGTHREERQESSYDLGTRNRRSVWTVATRPFSGAHFAVMPAALVEPCIAAGCPGGGVVLDPFLGSGTVGLVARRLGRQYVGIDLVPANCRMAAERIGDVELLPEQGAEAV